MKIIISGASGFIGKNFILRAPKSWDITAIYNNNNMQNFINFNMLSNVALKKIDLTMEKKVESVFSQFRDEYDVCLFLAANTSVPLSVEDPLVDLQSNTITLINTLKYIKFKKILFLSSGAVYDGLSGRVDPNVSVSPRIPYAISKLASENYIKFYARKQKISNYTILRFFGAYGPYEPARKIFTRLVNEFHIKKNKKFNIYGDGKNLIDAMYIDDAIDGILRVINRDGPDTTIDFCSGNPLDINELVLRAAKVFDITDPVVISNGIAEEYINFSVSNAAMKNLFGFEPTVSLDVGLKKLAGWIDEKQAPP